MPLNDSCLYIFSDEQPPDSYSGKEIELCNQQAHDFLNSTLLRDSDAILLSSRWKNAYLPWIPDFIRHIREINTGKIVIFGRTAEFKNIPDLIIRNGLSNDIEQLVATTRDRKIDSVNLRLKEMAQELKVEYIDKVSLMCSKDRSRCDVLDKEGNLIYYDYGHWTLEGAKYFGQKMIRSVSLSNLIRQDNLKKTNRRYSQ